MEFQLSYFKSWKMMLWKCCIQYASKHGKLSSGHRTEKGQFSFQSQDWKSSAKECSDYHTIALISVSEFSHLQDEGVTSKPYASDSALRGTEATILTNPSFSFKAFSCTWCLPAQAWLLDMSDCSIFASLVTSAGSTAVPDSLSALYVFLAK